MELLLLPIIFVILVEFFDVKGLGYNNHRPVIGIIDTIIMNWVHEPKWKDRKEVLKKPKYIQMKGSKYNEQRAMEHLQQLVKNNRSIKLC